MTLQFLEMKSYIMLYTELQKNKDLFVLSSTVTMATQDIVSF